MICLALAGLWAGCDPTPASSLPSGPCDLWADACGPDGKCEAYDSNDDAELDATRCVQPGEGAEGEACTISGELGSSGCDVGLVCLPDADGNGHCTAQCEGTEGAPACGELRETCIVMHDGLLPACLSDCDPLSDSCPGGMGCFVMGPDRAPVCLPEGSGGQDEACLEDDDCRAGLTCVDADQLPSVPGCEGTRCCTALCDEGSGSGDEACPENYSCNSLGLDQPGLEGVGFCGSRPWA